ncbi:YoaK family protein [Vibrio parahaemolyticus]|uniref:YoaK family protein n=1 Tax=Vibrio mediterranei TaxID=689 RepID=UPI004067C5E0
MVSKLPRWIESGAFVLSLLAGTVNAIGLMGFQHQAISHLSGTATLLGTQLFADWSVAAHMFAIIISFLIGSAISGLFISNISLKLGRQYEWLLCIESAFLIIASYLLLHGSLSGTYFASAACGLQNALATTFSGAVVRTTHVTGIVTDLGIMIGSTLRGEAFDRRKAKLFATILTGFVAGGVAGAMLYSRMAFVALMVPAVACIVLALVYRVYRKRIAYTSKAT